MIPWEQLDTAAIPGSDRLLRLKRRGSEISISIDGAIGELMNSRQHGSEEALAEVTCAPLAATPHARVLIGGLGLGFTLAAALRLLGPAAEVVVAELVPAVVTWNQGVAGEPAGYPVRDARTRVYEGDVADPIKAPGSGFDAILLDVDNGPEGLARVENGWLYSPAGLAAAGAALRPGGVLAIWSVAPNREFTRRMRQAGFAVEEAMVRARKPGKGGRHRIWLARWAR